MNKAQITKCVFSMGVSPRHKGFCYICEVLGLMAQGRAYLASCLEICKGHGVNRRAAERCMRYAVQFAWDMRQGCIRSEFGAEPNGGGLPPAMMDFLSVALWKLQTQSESRDQSEHRYQSESPDQRS